MQETAQEYTKRILGYVEGRKVMDVLASTPREVQKLVTGMETKRLDARPAPGKWSVTEILAHLADVEIVQSFRARLILGSPGVAIQGFDQDAWARYSDYGKQDPARSLDAWRVSRERTVRLLKSITPKLWKNYGMHTERGKETVLRVVEMMAGHDLNHLRQIRAALQGG